MLQLETVFLLSNVKFHIYCPSIQELFHLIRVNFINELLIRKISPHLYHFKFS